MAGSSPAPVSFKPDADEVPPAESRSILRRAWLAVSGALAALLGIAPHVLHHAGPLAGAALFAGVGGSLLFGGLGFVLAIPFLVRLHRRFANWRAPLSALVLFATLFSISTFVVGPAITGGGDEEASSQSRQDRQARPATNEGHEAHH